MQRVIAHLLNIYLLAISTHSSAMSSASWALQLRHCSTEAVSQWELSEFLFLYKPYPISIIVPFNVFEQFFLKQLGVSSIKEFIDNIDWVADAVKQWWIARRSVSRSGNDRAPL